MLRSWKSISVTVGLAALLLLGVTTMPNAAQLQNGNASTQTTIVADAPATNATSAKPAVSKKQKSVLDADVLESPFSFFKDMSGSDEDESEVNVKPSAVVLALKALAATLLSTIM
jgi:hypothetical protein